MAFFLSPFGGGEEWSELELRRRRQVQRETSARPRTQTSAQSRDARIITMFESTGAVCCRCSSGVFMLAGDDDASPTPGTAAIAAVRCRRLAGARMVFAGTCCFGVDSATHL